MVRWRSSRLVGVGICRSDKRSGRSGRTSWLRPECALCNGNLRGPLDSKDWKKCSSGPFCWLLFFVVPVNSRLDILRIDSELLGGSNRCTEVIV
ncbi:hypothetical protein CSUI_005124 [Cystoisospora suis]|uniref:Uncharacterized protein n=1 Tax=Cystoisospora suis TaxID=483139 RepID=A0A2C6KKK0_9APIC|nr:hypothetical protein CSUI_005124 [Cystoisospora suis]